MLNGSQINRREKEHLNIGKFDEEDSTSSSSEILGSINNMNREDQKIFSLQEEITSTTSKSDEDSMRYKPNYDKEKAL